MLSLSWDEKSSVVRNYGKIIINSLLFKITVWQNLLLT